MNPLRRKRDYEEDHKPMKTQTRKKSWTAKDFVTYWRKKYNEVYPGKDFFIIWMKDGAIMKRLMSAMSNRKLKAIIDFAFSEHSATNYLKKSGYPIALLPHSINNFIPLIDNPGNGLSKKELYLDVPVWDDERTSFIWKCIKQSDMDSLLCSVNDAGGWHVLLGKLQHQRGFVPEKVTWFYERWRMKEPLDRKGVS
jgi:hypothetical protein